MTLTPKPNGYEIRLRYGKGQRDRFLLRCDADTAADREPRMEAMARKLSALVDDSERAERVVDKICAEAAGSPPRSAASGTLTKPGPLTFADVVDEWCSGRLYDLDPERVNFKGARSLQKTREALAKFLPVLGPLRMDAIADADIVKAKACIPKGVDPDTRRLYLSRIRSVFRYSLRPLRLIQVIPEEIADVPSHKKTRNLFWFLYPDEEARLLACTRIPLAWRVLYGWLNRNGGRLSETGMLDYLRFDLVTGKVRIEAAWTKINQARFWTVEADVLAAMRAWRVLDGNPASSARVFHAPGRRSYATGSVINRLHGDLLLAGIDRAELHVTSDGSRRLRGHDFRTGFCTNARRRNMPDPWIMDRSGHTSVVQLEQYAKLARNADEDNLPIWWAPMHLAIPELAAAIAAGIAPAVDVVALARVGQGWAKPAWTSTNQASLSEEVDSITGSRSEGNQQETPGKTPPVEAKTLAPPTSGPASFQGVGQTGPGEGGPGPLVGTAEILSTDPVEKALAYALEEATKDKRYDVVLAVTRELEQRRLARAASNVTSLDSRRKPKGEGK